MTVCYFGIYKADYNRNKIIMAGLRANGLEILECNSRLKGPKKYFDLIKKHRALKNKYDVMIVGFPGYQAMILAKLITGRPIIFDAFFSLYDAMVNDRRAVSRLHPLAWYFWLLDWLSGSLADRILLDTGEHIKYFAKTFGLKTKKFIRVIIGADTDIFRPAPAKPASADFLVHFHGSYIRNQGINYIVDAAEKLRGENIIFSLVGAGQDFTRIKNRVDELKLAEKFQIRGFLPIEGLLDSVHKADLCLGIFGSGEKTQRIISNKIFECLACQKALLTADTPAMRELFSENEVAFCRAGDGEDLAEKILYLKNNPETRESLAKASYEFFTNNLRPAGLTAELAKIIGSLAEKK
ncbi:MAG: glycosyltransferase [Patescibacteria group bacterium]|jgi:glycosyltransferase involved in cell wall biosynthesis